MYAERNKTAWISQHDLTRTQEMARAMLETHNEIVSIPKEKHNPLNYDIDGGTTYFLK